MKTFEYNILSFPMTRKTSLSDMQASLNEKGADGWEVITAEAGDYGYTTFLKRETGTMKAASE